MAPTGNNAADMLQDGNEKGLEIMIKSLKKIKVRSFA